MLKIFQDQKEWTKSIEWNNILSEVLRWVRFHNVSDFLRDSSLQLRYLLRHGVLGWCDHYWIRIWAEKTNKVVISFESMRSWIGMIWHMANPICSRFPLPRTGCWYHEESVIYEWGAYWWPQSLSKVWLKIICQPHTTLQLFQAMAQPPKPVTELRRWNLGGWTR